MKAPGQTFTLEKLWKSSKTQIWRFSKFRALNDNN